MPLFAVPRFCLTRCPVIPVLLSALFIAACPLSVFAESTVNGRTAFEQALSERRFSTSRPYGGATSPNAARAVAIRAAHYAAMRSVMRDLAEVSEVRFAASMPTDWRPNLLALAQATVPTRLLLENTSRRDRTITVTVAVTIPRMQGVESRIRNALIQRDRLDLYGKAVLRDLALIAEYDAIMNADREGLRTDTSERIRIIIHEMEALALFIRELPSFAGVWDKPAATRAVLERAVTLAPENPLLLNALGDATLRIGRDQEAVALQTKAIRHDPTFARPLHSRAQAYLALGLASLAEADCTSAIALDPAKAAYAGDRGLARLLLENIEGMCEDFHTSCALGDCRKFDWAVGQNMCSAATAQEKKEKIGNDKTDAGHDSKGSNTEPSDIPSAKELPAAELKAPSQSLDGSDKSAAQ